MRYKAFLFLILSSCSLQIAIAQSRSYEAQDSLLKALYKEGSTTEAGIEALVYIHYESVEDRIRPSCALFYYDELGSFIVKSSHHWELKNSSEIILDLLEYVSDCKLTTELEFTQLEVGWLKKQLRLNSGKHQANFVYYNEIDSIGYFRTYNLLIDE